MSRALLSSLPDEVAELLATAPITEKLLELGVAWRGLSPAQARMVDALRVFVITWDPLESQAGRPAGFATSNAAAMAERLVPPAFRGTRVHGGGTESVGLVG